MQLKTVESLATTQLFGQQGDIIAIAGQKLIIETSPGGVEILDAEVPTGKQ